MTRLMTIVPGKNEDGTQSRFTKGTQVIDDNGVALSGVTKVVLEANVNDVWKAMVETTSIVLPPEGVQAKVTQQMKHIDEHVFECIADLLRAVIDQTGKQVSCMNVTYDETGEVITGVEVNYLS